MFSTVLKRLTGVQTHRRADQAVQPGPDFLCIGAPKTGTTWLFEQLSDHPDFWMPPVKELHGLDFRSMHHSVLPTYEVARTNLEALNEKRAAQQLRALTPADIQFLEKYLRFVPSLSMRRYAELFAPKNGLMSGDITPAYSALKRKRIRRIATRFPRLKVMFFARDPVDRFWSQYCMRLRHRKAEFTAEVVHVQKLLLTPWAIQRSFPTRIVRRWRDHFPADRFQTFFFDDLKSSPARLRQDILIYLGANPSKGRDRLPENFNRKSGEAQPMPRDVERFLTEHFADELRACAAHLGGPALLWPAKHGI